MGKTEWQLPDILDKLRWIVPALLAAFGVGYSLFDHLFITSAPFPETHMLREAIVIGIVGPTLTALLLTWATAIARSRQQAMEFLRRRAIQMEAASQVGQKVTAILEVDELLTQIVNLIQDKFGYYHVHLFLVDGPSNEIVMRECSGQAREAIMTQGLRLKIGSQGITGQVAQSGEPILCNDVSQEPRYHPHELLSQTRSELAIPLRIGDVVVGVLDVQSEQLNAFREDDIVTLQMLGDQVAIAIENANLFRETQHRFDIMRALHDISLKITSRLDSDRVLQLVLEQATQLLKAQGGSIGVYDPETKLIYKVAHTNAEYQALVLRVGEGIAGRVVATGKPLVINDLQHWEGRLPLYKDASSKAIISVPLLWRGEVFGALNVVDDGQRGSFDKNDVELMKLFADLVSIAVKNAELYAQVVQLSQHLEQKVEQRTNQLVMAREELAQKAEQLRRLLADMVRVQEEERARIALDLHDGSNQLITGTLFEIQAAQQSILSQQEKGAFETLETAKKLLRQIEAENRRIISGLHPPILDAQGLVPTLRWYVADCKKHLGLTCSIEVSGEPIRLSPETEVAVYRIVQESLNNVAAHAQAENVEIRIGFRSTRLFVVIEDDGVGFTVEEGLATATDHMGLIGMRERAQSIDGQLEIDSVLGGGTRIILDVPLSIEPEPETVKALETI